MSTDVDQILRAHADEAGRAVPPPDGWARLEQRLADGDGALVIPIDLPSEDPSRRRRTIWLAAAAALLIVLASVGVLAATREDDQSVEMTPVTEPPTTDAPATTEAPTTTPTTASSTPTTTEATTTTEPPPALPTSVIALIDADGDAIGDLVVLGADGEVQQVLVQSEAGVPGLEEGGARGPTSFDVLPDGRVVYEMCCEPAGGDVYVIDPGSGDPTYVGYGRNPTASPDGGRVAVSVFYSNDEIHVFDLAAGPEAGGPLVAGGEAVVIEDDGRWVDGMAWSPDGSRLAIATSRNTSDGEVDPMVEVVDLASGQRTEIPGAVDAAFLADGRLLVSTDAEQDGSEYPQLVATSLAIFDPATGETQAHVGGVRILDLAATADGRWVLAVAEGGAVRAFATEDGADRGTVVTVTGLVSAAG